MVASWSADVGGGENVADTLCPFARTSANDSTGQSSNVLHLSFGSPHSTIAKRMPGAWPCKAPHILQSIAGLWLSLIGAFDRSTRVMDMQQKTASMGQGPSCAVHVGCS